MCVGKSLWSFSHRYYKTKKVKEELMKNDTLTYDEKRHNYNLSKIVS